jgi:hypothetical protein
VGVEQAEPADGYAERDQDQAPDKIRCHGEYIFFFRFFQVRLVIDQEG